MSELIAEKIQKVLARTGFASRRQVERWIAEQRISVDGVVAQIGDRIHAENKVSLDGKPLFLSWEKDQQRVLIYHKPEGEICSRKDAEHKKTIFDNLPQLSIGRWISVGRLDINTTGLILLTTDGELASRLMHPSHEIEREYAVRILGEVTEEMLKNMTSGVILEDGMAKFDKLSFAGGEGSNRWYHVTLKEGRNREVRRIWESQGVTVSRLSRVKFGNIALKRSLRPGKFSDLSEQELKQLYQSVGLQYYAKPKSQRNKNTSRRDNPWSTIRRNKLLTPKRANKKNRH